MLLLLLFPLVEKFPKTCEQQKNAEELFHQRHIRNRRYPGTDAGSHTSADYDRKNAPEGNRAILPPKETGDHRRGQEEKQIDGSDCGVIHTENKGEP